MSIKQAFEKWQRANDKVNTAEDAVRAARFDFRTAENQFYNQIATHGPYTDRDVTYYIDENNQLAFKPAENKS